MLAPFAHREGVAARALSFPGFWSDERSGSLLLGNLLNATPFSLSDACNLPDFGEKPVASVVWR